MTALQVDLKENDATFGSRAIHRKLTREQVSRKQVFVCLTPTSVFDFCWSDNKPRTNTSLFRKLSDESCTFDRGLTFFSQEKVVLFFPQPTFWLSGYFFRLLLQSKNQSFETLTNIHPQIRTWSLFFCFFYSRRNCFRFRMSDVSSVVLVGNFGSKNACIIERRKISPILLPKTSRSLWRELKWWSQSSWWIFGPFVEIRTQDDHACFPERTDSLQFFEIPRRTR